MAKSPTPAKIALRPSLQKWAERQVKAGDFDSAADFVNHVLELARQNRRDLEAELLAGLNSGPARPFDADAMERIVRKSKIIAEAIRKAKKLDKPTGRKSA